MKIKNDSDKNRSCKHMIDIDGKMQIYECYKDPVCEHQINLEGSIFCSFSPILDENRNKTSVPPIESNRKFIKTFKH